MDLRYHNKSKIKYWWKTKADKVIWKKQLYHDHIIMVDGWGISSNPDNCYEFDIDIYKVFSLKNGFTYQIKAPNIVINEKKLLDGIGELLRYLYNGECPCYFRLVDTLMHNGVWRKLE